MDVTLLCALPLLAVDKILTLVNYKQANYFQLENLESFKYLGSMLTNDRRFTVKLNPGLFRQKLHLTRRELFLVAKWTWN
jgi:hypothetical protein